MSIRLQIIQDVVTRLNTARPAGVPVARLRRPLPTNKPGLLAGSANELNVYFATESKRPATNKHGPLSSKELRFIAETRMVAASLEQIETVLEPAHTWLEDTLESAGPSSLFHGISFTNLAWVPVQEDRLYAVSLMMFTVEYQTNRYQSGLVS